MDDKPENIGVWETGTNQFLNDGAEPTTPWIDMAIAPSWPETKGLSWPETKGLFRIRRGFRRGEYISFMCAWSPEHGTTLWINGKKKRGWVKRRWLRRFRIEVAHGRR